MVTHSPNPNSAFGTSVTLAKSPGLPSLSFHPETGSPLPHPKAL